jgi:hypothetical protein
LDGAFLFDGSLDVFRRRGVEMASAGNALSAFIDSHRLAAPMIWALAWTNASRLVARFDHGERMPHDWRARALIAAGTEHLKPQVRGTGVSMPAGIGFPAQESGLQIGGLRN